MQWTAAPRAAMWKPFIKWWAARSRRLSFPQRAIKELKRSLHKDLLIACIVRGEKTIIPGGDDCIKAGDRVIVVTKHILFNDLTDVLTENLQ